MTLRRKRSTKKMNWDKLVMWDNVDFSASSYLSEPQLKKLKKILNGYLNNVAYDGYIKKNKINMNPEIKQYNKFKKDIYYNVYAYPLPLPQSFPEDVFKILPSIIQIDDVIIIKKSASGI
jgi:hypothetical protein